MISCKGDQTIIMTAVERQSRCLIAYAARWKCKAAGMPSLSHVGGLAERDKQSRFIKAPSMCNSTLPANPTCLRKTK